MSGRRSQALRPPPGVSAHRGEKIRGGASELTRRRQRAALRAPSASPGTDTAVTPHLLGEGPQGQVSKTERLGQGHFETSKFFFYVYDFSDDNIRTM